MTYVLNEQYFQAANIFKMFVAGDEGFEPPISGPEPGALPLGQSPLKLVCLSYISRFLLLLTDADTSY